MNMKIRNIPCIVFDIEVFINCFHCTCYNTETNTIAKFEISARKNQVKEMCAFFLKEDAYFVGYNNIHYDNPIINYCIEFFSKTEYPVWTMCNSIYNLSQVILDKNGDLNLWKAYKYAKNFKTLDLLTMLYSQALRVSLKSMQITMHFPKAQEFITDWKAPLETERLDEMIEYNINDVMSTTELLNRCKKDILLRINIEDEYKIQCLSKDGVGIGTELLKQKYLAATKKTWDMIKDLRSPMDIIPLKDVILPKISYTTPILQSLLERLKTCYVGAGRGSLKETFILDGVRISVGVGGIHSKNDPEIIIPKDDEFLIDCDAASLYPSLLIEYGFYPKHLGPEFVDIYKGVRTERLEAKHSGQKLKDKTLKLLLNAVTGNLQNEFSWLYSPFAVMQIRMNGQLLLLKLAEGLIGIGCKIIQYNTDGLFLICKKNKKAEYDRIVREFETFSQLTMEDTFFDSMYQLAINDYFAVTSDGEVKCKGIFIEDVIQGKGLTPKIIPKAIRDYFLKGIPVLDTLKNATDIKDFLMSEKTGSQWTVEYNNVIQQRINRFYASTNGAYLWKWKLSGYEQGEILTGPWPWDNTPRVKNAKEYQNMLAESGVTLLNNFDEMPISERKINYRYYLKQCLQIIEKIKPRQLSLFS